MRKLDVNGHVLLFEERPEHLKQSLLVEHNFYALIESGIGHSFDDIDEHFNTAIALVQEGDIEQALTELDNTRFLFYNLLNKQYPASSLALCCLLVSIDDVQVDDYTEDGLQRISERLAELGVTDELITAQWGALKKNSLQPLIN